SAPKSTLASRCRRNYSRAQERPKACIERPTSQEYLYCVQRRVPNSPAGMCRCQHLCLTSKSLVGVATSSVQRVWELQFFLGGHSPTFLGCSWRGPSMKRHGSLRP